MPAAATCHLQWRATAAATTIIAAALRGGVVKARWRLSCFFSTRAAAAMINDSAYAAAGKEARMYGGDSWAYAKMTSIVVNANVETVKLTERRRRWH